MQLAARRQTFPGIWICEQGVESFAVFFQPAGWSMLFKTPVCEMTNRFMDATAVGGSSLRELWNRLGEVFILSHA